MVDLLASMQSSGLTSGLLRLEHRRKVVAGETRHFPVPVLSLADSMDALAAGDARYRVIAPQARAEIGAGESADREAAGGSFLPICCSPAPPDDDVIDAELVDERTLADVLPSDVAAGRALGTARRLARDFGVPEPTALDDVTDTKLIAAVLVEVGT